MARAPVPVYDWRYCVNIQVTDPDDETMRQHLLSRIVQCLLGQVACTDNEGAASSITTPWTVYYSCDGTTAGSAGDGVDRWTSDPAANINWNAAGSLHSWMVLVHEDFFGVGVPLYLLLDCTQSSSSYANAAMGVYFSAAGFTGGTTTARPTAADERQILPSNGTYNNANWQGDYQGTDIQKVLHFTMTDDGTKFRIHLCDGGFCVARWDLFRVEDPPAGWSTPVLMHIMGQTGVSERNVWNINWNTGGNGAQYLGRDGTLGNFGCYACIPCYSTSETIFNTQPANSFDGTIMPAPIQLVADGGSVSGPIAVVPDCWWVYDGNGTGDHAENDAGEPRAFAQFGDMLIEWNRTTVITS